MDHYGLVAGEKIYLQVPDGSGKKEISFVVSQICREKDINDPYWAKTLSDMGDVIFVSQDVFDEMMQYYSEDNISYSDFLMLDYTQINTENASLYDGYMEQFKDADKLYNDNIRDTLERFFYTAEDDKADALGVGAAVSCAFDFIYKNDICTDTFARAK